MTRAVGGDVHDVRIDLHRRPAPESLQPDLAAVGGPLHAPDEGANPLCHGVDGRGQTVARFVERVSVLHESGRRGMASLPPGSCG